MPDRIDESVVRVILAGRSPLDRTLRRDARVELVRARSALEAIGEAAIDEDLPRGSRVVVLVPEGEIREGELGSFLDALERVDPATEVVCIGQPVNGAEPGVSARCGWVAPGAPTEDLSTALGVSQRREEPARARERVVEPEPSGPFETMVGAARAPGPIESDRQIAQTLLAGRDVLHPCLVRLRESNPAADIEYISALNVRTAPVPGDARRLVPVQHRDRLFGWLIGATNGPASAGFSLEDAAAWLATWLALRDQHAQLRAAAFTDPLTGAWNRRYLDRFLNMAIERARGRRHDVTLLLFDIDDFKRYNDRFGHPAGDDILREIVRLLNSVIRPTDRVCRIGGDEFAVVFDEPEGPRDLGSQHPVSIYEIARRFQEQILEHRFPKLGDQARGTLTISGGMATFPWDASDAEALLDRADQLILESKQSGKNAIRIGPGVRKAVGDSGVGEA